MYRGGNKFIKAFLLTPKVKDSGALTKKQELVVYYFTILGTLASVVLAIFSIYLTLKISQTATKIEKMDALLQLMSDQNKIQNENIKKLTELQKNSVELSLKLSEQISSTREQTAFLQDNYAPDISIGKISFSKSNIEKGQNILGYEFRNIGGRRLKNLHSRVAIFFPTPSVQDSIYYFGTFTPNISDGNTTDLKPNSQNFHYISIPINDILDSAFSIATMAILVNYIDPLTKSEKVKPFFYQNKKGLNGDFISIYAPPKQVRIIRAFIDSSREMKKMINYKNLVY